MLNRCILTDEYVVLEKPSQQTLLGDQYLSFTILNPTSPLPFIIAAIGPVHLTVAMPQILKELSLIVVPCGPLINSVSTLPVVDVLAFVLVLGVVGEPNAFAVAESVLELSSVRRTVLPLILPFAFGLPVHVHPDVDITIGELLRALSMLEAVLELPLVLIA